MKKFLSLTLVSTILLSSIGLVSAFTLETLDASVSVDDTPENADAVVVDANSSTTDNSNSSTNDSNNDSSVNDSNNDNSFTSTDNSDNSIDNSGNSTDNTNNSVNDSNNSTDNSVTDSNNDSSVNNSNNTTDNSVVNNYDYSVTNNYNVDGDYYEEGSNNSTDDSNDDDSDNNSVVFYDYYRPQTYTPVVRPTYYQPVRTYDYRSNVDFVNGAYADNRYDPYLPGVSGNTTEPSQVTYNYASTSTGNSRVVNEDSSATNSETGYLGDYEDLDIDAPLVEGPTQYWGFPTIEEFYGNGVSADRADKEKRVAKFFETYVDDVLEFDEYFLITFKNPFNGKIIFTFKFTKP